MKTLIFTVCLLSLTACASTKAVLMKHPQSGDVKECHKVDPWRHWPWQEEAVIQACIEQYKKAGYEEVR